MDNDEVEKTAERLFLLELAIQMNDGIPVKEEEVEDLGRKNPDKFEEIRQKVYDMYQDWVKAELKRDVKQALSKLSPNDNEGVFELSGVCPDLMGFPMMYKDDYPACKKVHCYECWSMAIGD